MPTGWLRGVVKAVPSGDQVVIAAPAAPGVRRSTRVARNRRTASRKDSSENIQEPTMIGQRLTMRARFPRR